MIKGAFLYSMNLADLRAKENELDRKQFFRSETKKQMSRWVTEERKFINRVSKKDWVPSKLTKNDAFFNYLFSVIMNVSPHQTPEEIVHQFYDCIHPFFIQYFHVAITLKKNLKHGMTPDQIVHLKRMTQDLPDIFKRSEQVIDTKRQIVKKIKQLEKNMRRAEDLKNKQIDAEMVKKNIEMLKQSIDERNEQIEAYNRALKEEIAEDESIKEKNEKEAQRKPGKQKVHTGQKNQGPAPRPSESGQGRGKGDEGKVGNEDRQPGSGQSEAGSKDSGTRGGFSEPERPGVRTEGTNRNIPGPPKRRKSRPSRGKGRGRDPHASARQGLREKDNDPYALSHQGLT